MAEKKQTKTKKSGKTLQTRICEKMSALLRDDEKKQPKVDLAALNTMSKFPKEATIHVSAILHSFKKYAMICRRTITEGSPVVQGANDIFPMCYQSCLMALRVLGRTAATEIQNAINDAKEVPEKCELVTALGIVADKTSGDFLLDLLEDTTDVELSTRIIAALGTLTFNEPAKEEYNPNH